MEKAFYFENDCGALHRCAFAGIDNEGRAQWVMVDQGDEVMTLQEYMDENGLENHDMRLLCLENETVEASTMALLLGAVLRGYPANSEEALSDTVRSLKRRGIDWWQGMVQLRVIVNLYFDDCLEKNCYRVFVFDNEVGEVMDLDGFVTWESLMNTLRCYFDALESECGIGLRRTLRTYSVDLLTLLSDEDKRLFNVIEM